MPFVFGTKQPHCLGFIGFAARLPPAVANPLQPPPPDGAACAGEELKQQSLVCQVVNGLLCDSRENGRKWSREGF